LENGKRLFIKIQGNIKFIVPENLCLIFNDGVVLARALGHLIPHWPEERLNDQ